MAVRTEVIGSRLREARIEKGITQEELAERMGISVPTIRHYEANRRTPGTDSLQRIADILGVAPQSLYRCTIACPRDALELLFRLENEYGARPVGNDCLKIAVERRNEERLAEYLDEWYRMRCKLELGEISERAYEHWKRTLI